MSPSGHECAESGRELDKDGPKDSMEVNSKRGMFKADESTRGGVGIVLKRESSMIRFGRVTLSSIFTEEVMIGTTRQAQPR